ncbi:MAG: C45 family autoproteolytic acyltransferase/hydrolase [Candidatus Kapabacteria bacterium]|jgi:predicted choloylglycine hydrolase|nr:C45 family autoproteolytic acyltransferase/hydrolase [Candidatus Kapabacteria bacterium]
MIRRDFLKLSILTPAFIQTACKQANNVNFVAGNEKSFDFLEVRGSYYDIGFQIGSFFVKNIKAVIQDRPGWIENLLEIVAKPAGRAFADELYNNVKKFFPHMYEELEGMAAGAKMDFEIIKLMSINSELNVFEKENPGCSTIFYKDDKRIWHFHNEDGHMAYTDRMFVLKAHPPSGVSYVSFVYPGMITGVGPSINSRGIILTTNYIASLNPLPGIPRYFLGRAILEAKSLDEAFKFASKTPRAFPWHHNIMSVKDQKYISVETLPEGTVNKYEPNGFYLHTNHTIGDLTKDYAHQNLEYKNSSSVSRYEVLERKIEASGGKIDKPETVLGWLSSHENKPYSPCRHPAGDVTGATLGTAFFDVKKGVLRLYKGNPCKAVPNRLFTEYRV